jgi:hypothetical protein
MKKPATAQLRIQAPAARARKARTTPTCIYSTDPETEEILRDPAAMAAINDYKAGKVTRWYTMEEVFGED